MNTQLLIAGLMLGCSALVGAAVPDIYPKPQQVSLQDIGTTVQQVQLLMRTSDSKGGMWEQLPADNTGAYAIEVTEGKLCVWANSEEAAFYAKQTLSQMLLDVPGAQDAQRDPFPGESLEQVATKGKLPLGTVIDWPDLAFRGTVEGYYGAPWSYEARQSQFDFYGRNKMNTYIYAPKDDPYHHGLGCYKPYPANKAAEIRQLVQYARKNHVRFVWGIHPANTVKWDEEGGRAQLDGLCQKLQWMYELGVRDFAVLVDDSFGEIGKAERQVQLTNYILENFIRKHPDVNQTLIMCPTGYNKAWTNAKFLTTLGTGLDKSIPVMWTGDTVVHDITLKGQQWVNQHVQRPTFIWWNWPCNDFKRSRISMGRTYGLGTEPEMKTAMSGFVANPMEHAEASKVGLFGVADYTWNIEDFESEKSWRSGIKRLYPQCAEAMQVFCDHNSYLLPNGHGYYREESVAFNEAAATLMRSIELDDPDQQAAASLKAEFERMAKVGDILLEARGITELQQDIAPWIAQFSLTGLAGTHTMTSLMAKDDGYQRVQSFYNALDVYASMQLTERDEWSPEGTKYLSDVQVAMHSMVPAMENAMIYINRNIYAMLSGRKSALPTFHTNGGPEKKDPLAVMDHNEKTFWSSDRRMKKGDWYCLDFGAPIDIRNLVLVTGGPRPGDVPGKGVFEVSDDGVNWQVVGTPRGGSNIVVNFREPVSARMVRYRITEPLQRWLAICEFATNRSLPFFVNTNMEQHPAFTTFKESTALGLSRIMEVFPIASGEYIDLEFPAPLTPENIYINLENPSICQWSTVTLTHSDGSVTTLKGEADKDYIYLYGDILPKKPVVGIRLTNSADTTQEIKLHSFRVTIPADQGVHTPHTLTDCDLTTFYNCDNGELDLTFDKPKNAKSVMIVGTGRCTVNGKRPQISGIHVEVFPIEDVEKVRINAPQQYGKRLFEIIFSKHEIK